MSEGQIERYLSKFTGSRAEVVHAGLLELRDKSDEIFIVTAELVWEVHTKGHWRAVQDATGRPYTDEDAYRNDVLGLAARNAENYQRIGRMIAVVPDARRAEFRLGLCDVGVSKAIAIAPAIERGADVDEWLGMARRLPQRDLRRIATKRLALKPHGQRPAKMRFMAALTPRGVPENLAARAYDAGAAIHGALPPDKMLVKIIEAALVAWKHTTVKRVAS